VCATLRVLKDAAARQSLRELMRDYHRELVADRGMDMEAQVLEIIQELREFEPSDVSIREITNRLADQHGEDFGRKITAHWVGYLVRKKLGLKTERRKAGYVIGSIEGTKLARLFEKYGIVRKRRALLLVLPAENLVEKIGPCRASLHVSIGCSKNYGF
jgi:hypothetical protein